MVPERTRAGELSYSFSFHTACEYYSVTQSAAAFCRHWAARKHFLQQAHRHCEHDLRTAAAAVTDSCSVALRIKYRDHNVSAALANCVVMRIVAAPVTAEAWQNELVSLLAAVGCLYPMHTVSELSAQVSVLACL
jgi:hypothetical protein